MLYISTKFFLNIYKGFRVTEREIIPKGFSVIEWIRNHDRRTGGQTDRRTDKVITIGPPPTSSGGALNRCNFNLSSVAVRSLHFYL